MIGLVVEIKKKNPRFGYRRIAMRIYQSVGIPSVALRWAGFFGSTTALYLGVIVLSHPGSRLSVIRQIAFCPGTPAGLFSQM